MTEITTKKLSADLPIQIIRPIVEELYEPFKRRRPRNTKARFPGLKTMSQHYGINDKTIYDILCGNKDRIAIHIVDKLTMHSHFDLDTIYEDTVKWAKENPKYGWPEDY